MVSHLEDYSKYQPEREVPPTAIPSVYYTEDKIVSLLAKDQLPPPLPSKATGWEEELKGYLNLKWSATNPYHFWRENTRNFPTLAGLAQDVFSIPATGAGVKRLFSTARDICHYRRGSLNESTI
ncbi:hypothetical protein AAEP93_004178 [Penicillium crustosum]